MTNRNATTTTTSTAAADLRLNDQVLLSKWDGTVELATVCALRLLNDDVEVEFFNRGEMLTNRKQQFLVVASTEAAVAAFATA